MCEYALIKILWFYIIIAAWWSEVFFLFSTYFINFICCWVVKSWLQPYFNIHRSTTASLFKFLGNFLHFVCVGTYGLNLYKLWKNKKRITSLQQNTISIFLCLKPGFYKFKKYIKICGLSPKAINIFLIIHHIVIIVYYFVNI